MESVLIWILRQFDQESYLFRLVQTTNGPFILSRTRKVLPHFKRNQTFRVFVSMKNSYARDPFIRKLYIKHHSSKMDFANGPIGVNSPDLFHSLLI